MTALSTTVGWYLATTAGLGALFWIYGRAVSGGDRRQAVRRLGYAARGGLVVAGFLAYGVLVWQDADALVEGAVASALGVSASGTVPDLIGLGVVLAGSGASVIAAYLGLFPHVVRVRDLDLPATRSAARVGRYVAVLLAILYALLALPRLGGTSATMVLGLGGLLLVGVVVASPWLIRLQMDTREPHADERERLDAASERVVLDPAAIGVVDLAAEETALVALRGPPGRRTLFVSNYLLSAADDERLAVLLGTKTGLARRWYLEARVGVLLVLLVILVSALFGWLGAVERLVGVDGSLIALTGLVLTLLAAWGVGRLVYAADADVADRLGAETVAATLEWYADDQDLSTERNRLLGLLRMRPSIGRRIARLGDGVATGDAGDHDGGADGD